MKDPQSSSHLLSTLILIALVAAILFVLDAAQQNQGVAFQQNATPTLSDYPPPATSTPAPTETQASYPQPATPTAQTTSPPTVTPPPPPPAKTPTTTPTPSPPTPTAEPLPPLVPTLQTMVYATSGEQGPELYRVQLEPTGHIVGQPRRLHTPELWRSRVYLEALYPSPTGRHVAVAWRYGEGGNFISILDIAAGTLTPLFGENAKIDQRAFFLDWQPDGTGILVGCTTDHRCFLFTGWGIHRVRFS